MTSSSSRSASPASWLGVVIGAALLTSLYLVFWVAPREAEMGLVYRIFYFHVSSAITALLCFMGCAVLSVGYLVLRRMEGFAPLGVRADRLAHAMGEIGVLLGLIVLLTGPLWAKPAWGTFWTWEPRLTLMLLTVFLFVGYLVLRGYAGSDETGRRLSAGIAVIGAPATYLIHIAVERWGGNHPQVVTGEGGGLADPLMQWTFGVTLTSVGALVAFLVQARYAHHATRDVLEDLFLDLEDLEDER